MRDGTFPLWNPHFLGGAPFLASPQSSMFYPPNALYYVLSVPTAWTLCFMLRMFISGVFMTAFVRSIGGTKGGSIFGGLVFALCAFMTSWQGQPMADAAAWLPLVCYAVIRLQNQPSGRSIALAAFAFAMPCLQDIQSRGPCNLVNRNRRLCLDRLRLNLHFLSRFTAAGILAVALSVQVIPTLEWLAQMPSPLDIRWPVLAAHGNWPGSPDIAVRQLSRTLDA
jgi:hypothetical protein